MRLFIAVSISEEVKKEAERIQTKTDFLKKSKPVPKENMHLTIKFIGETTETKNIIEKLKKISFEPFTITSDKIGFFPNKKNIKILWIGFKESQELTELQKKIETTLKEHNKKFKFKPHTTITRIKNITAEETTKMNKIKETINIKEEKTEIKSFKLMKSTLTQKGSIYEEIAEFRAKAL